MYVVLSKGTWDYCVLCVVRSERGCFGRAQQAQTARGGVRAASEGKWMQVGL